MRINLLLSFGASLLPVIAYSTMQGQSVADMNISASQEAIEISTILSTETLLTAYNAPKNIRPKHNYAAELQRLRNERRTARIIKQTTITTPNTAPSPVPVTATLIRPTKTPRLLTALNKSDIADTHKQIANDVLLSLPETCRETLKYFYVRYEPQEHRGLAGKSVMILDGTVPNEEFRALFIHETGHNWDIGCTTGTPESGKSVYSDSDEAVYNNDPSVDFYAISWTTSSVRKSSSKPDDFVSGYGASNAFEDFAESFAYFVLQNEAFKARAEVSLALAKKYAYIRDVYFGGTVPNVAIGLANHGKSVPWDTTKLTYVWSGKETLLGRK